MRESNASHHRAIRHAANRPQKWHLQPRRRGIHPNRIREAGRAAMRGRRKGAGTKRRGIGRRAKMRIATCNLNSGAELRMDVAGRRGTASTDEAPLPRSWAPQATPRCPSACRSAPARSTCRTTDRHTCDIALDRSGSSQPRFPERHCRLMDTLEKGTARPGSPRRRSRPV